MDVAWIYLLAASLLEVVWVIALEKSEGFKNVKWTIFTIVTVMLCLYLLALAVAGIGPGVAYAILAGIGAVGVVVSGYILYNEHVSLKRVFFIVLVIAGIIGVRLASGGIL